MGIEDGDSQTESTLKLGAKYVTKVSGKDVNLEGEYATNDGESIIRLAGDYYLNNALSVGAAIGLPSASGAETEIELGARYFFMPNISGQVSYTLNEGNADGDSALGLGVTARF